jgi:MFS family permease
VGSIVGTFALGRRASLSRSAVSYALLAVSALLWPLAQALAAGVLCVLLSGVLEGPAFSASIALRQRHVPPTVRAQVTTTIVGSIQVSSSAAAAVGGAIADPLVLIFVFVGLNVAAAGVAAVGHRRSVATLAGMPRSEPERAA